jgi:hypothetical protein
VHGAADEHSPHQYGTVGQAFRQCHNIW